MKYLARLSLGILAILLIIVSISGCTYVPPSLPTQASLSADQQKAYDTYSGPDTFKISMDDNDRFEVWNYYSEGKSISFLNGKLYEENKLAPLSAEFKFPKLSPTQFRNLKKLEDVVAVLGAEPTAWGSLNQNIEKDVNIYDYFDQIKVVTKAGKIIFVQTLPVFAPDVKTPKEETKGILPLETPKDNVEIIPPEAPPVVEPEQIPAEWSQDPKDSWAMKDGKFEAKNDRMFQFLGRQTAYKDYVVEVDINNPSDTGILIRGSYSNVQFAGKAYIFRPLWNDHYWITKDYAGFAMAESYTKLLSPKTGKIHVKIVVQGTEFKAYVDGEEIVSYSDTENKFAGDWVALYSYRTGQSFENFKITSLEAGQ